MASYSWYQCSEHGCSASVRVRRENGVPVNREGRVEVTGEGTHMVLTCRHGHRVSLSVGTSAHDHNTRVEQHADTLVPAMT